MYIYGECLEDYNSSLYVIHHYRLKSVDHDYG